MGSIRQMCAGATMPGSYDFISITDDLIGSIDYPITLTSDTNSDSFNTIPGAELHSGAMQSGDIWHLLAVGLPTDFPPTTTPASNPKPTRKPGLKLPNSPVDADGHAMINTTMHAARLTESDRA